MELLKELTTKTKLLNDMIINVSLKLIDTKQTSKSSVNQLDLIIDLLNIGDRAPKREIRPKLKSLRSYLNDSDDLLVDALKSLQVINQVVSNQKEAKMLENIKGLLVKYENKDIYLDDFMKQLGDYLK